MKGCLFIINCYLHGIALASRQMNLQLTGVAHQPRQVIVTAMPPTEAKWNCFLPGLAHSDKNFTFIMVKRPLPETNK